MKKYIVREVPAEQADFSSYFDNDGLREAGGDYCYNLFIVAQSRNCSGFNEKEYTSLQNEIESLLEMYEDIVNKSSYAQYSSVGAMLFDLGLVNNIHNTRRIKEIAEWLKACNEKPTSPYRNYGTQAEAFPEETTAKYLTFKTGKEWTTESAYGYSQGDYVKMVYCPEHYTSGVKNYGEIWLGVGKEFSITFLDEEGEEDYTVYGYIIADSQARTDEDYKKLVCEWEGIPEDETQLEMIDSYRTITEYTYRNAQKGVRNMNNDKMTLYRRYKARAEDTAIEWQLDFNNHNYSYGELVYFQDYFTRLAKRYGLTKVFRENGIL